MELTRSALPGAEDFTKRYRLECEGADPDTGFIEGEREFRLEVAGPWFREMPELDARTRVFPVIFDYAHREHQTMTFAAPPGMSPGEPPSPVEMDGPYGSYSLVVSVEGNAYVVKRTFRLARPRTEPPAASGLRKFFLDVRKGDQTQLVFVAAGGGA
jgi:hypothetical protein